MIRLLKPWRLTYIPYPRTAVFTLLDIGCANESPSLTKRWFPSCRYTGVDIDEKNAPGCDEFLLRDLNVPAKLGSHDFVMMAHVIEHLSEPFVGLRSAMDAVARGGRIYLEYPAPRSLHLPSMEGTLNFYDDPTHVYLPEGEKIREALVKGGFRIIRHGTRRDWRALILAPARVPLLFILRGGKTRSSDWWDLLGFADYVYAERPS